MSRWRKIALAVGLVAAVAMACLLLRARAREPVHEGKSASEWFRMATVSTTNYPAVQKVLRSMGTNALPVYIEKMKRRETRLHHWYKSTLAKASPGLQRFLPNLGNIETEQMLALNQLHNLGPAAQAAVPAILDWIEDDSRRVPTGTGVAGRPPRVMGAGMDLRAMAVRAITRIGGEDKRIISAIIEEAGSSQIGARLSFEMRSSQLEQLRPAAKQSVRELINAATNSSTKLTSVCLMGLVAEESNEVVGVLARIVHENDGVTGQWAAVALGNARSEFQTAVPALIVGLSMTNNPRSFATDSRLSAYTHDAYCRSAAIALTNLAHRCDLVIPALIEALSSENNRIRTGAAAIIKSIGPPAGKALQALRSLADTDDPALRYQALYAIHALSNEKDPLFEAKLLELRDGGEATRCDVVNWLQREGRNHSRAVPVLMDALAKDSSFRVRGFSARALGELRAREAVPALTAALNDEWYNVKDEAAEALKKIAEQR